MRDMMQLVWRDLDGITTWDLRHGFEGVKLMRVRGLGIVAPQYDEIEGAGVDGVETVGESLPARTVVLTCKMTTRDVEGRQAAFWRSVARGGWLEIEDAHGRIRTLRLKFRDDGGISYAYQPHIGQDPFTITFQADDPWFLGPAVVTPFDTAADQGEFFGPNGDDAPPFIIADAYTVGRVTVSNPGDVPAWPVWRIHGPASAFAAQVGDRLLAGDPTILEGQTLTVYTDPRQGRAAILTGAGIDGEEDRTDALTSYGFAQVGPGESVDMTVTVTGSGSASVELQPRYRRGIG